MAETNPVLFYSIAIIFLAFTTAWIVFAFRNKPVNKFRKRIDE